MTNVNEIFEIREYKGIWVVVDKGAPMPDTVTYTADVERDRFRMEPEYDNDNIYPTHDYFVSWDKEDAIAKAYRNWVSKK